MKKKRHDSLPPKLIHLFFKWYCKRELYEEMHGDLEELYNDKLDKYGRLVSNIFYIYDVLRCFQPYAWKKVKTQNKTKISMFRNYYFTSIRNFKKHGSSFFIRIGGLSIAIASFLLIIWYVTHELNYDKFHPDYKYVYRVNQEADTKTGHTNWATTHSPLARTLLKMYPEVIDATRILRMKEELVRIGDIDFHEENLLHGDPSFFTMFQFEMINGNSKNALKEPNSLVITESYKRKYFREINPIGQTVLIGYEEKPYIITGIIADPPKDSHLKFNLIGSLSSDPKWFDNKWIAFIGGDLYTYIKLSQQIDPQSFDEKLESVFYNYVAPEIEGYTGMTIAEWEEVGNAANYYLTALEDIHLHSVATNDLEIGGNINYIRIYFIVGLIILFVAIFNFINISMALSYTRATEVGVRKTLGSTIQNLVSQFVLESVLLSFFATFLGVIIVWILTPFFFDLIGKELSLDRTSVVLWFSLFLFAILVGILGGLYPSVLLARMNLTDSLKGSSNKTGKLGLVRRVLVTMQLSVSTVIIIVTLVVYSQVNHMLTKNLGFSKELKLIIKRSQSLGDDIATFKDALRRNSNISATTTSETIPGEKYARTSIRKMGEPEVYRLNSNVVDYNHLDFFKIEMASGRFYSKEYGRDSGALVINESAALALGFEEAVGKRVKAGGGGREEVTIIGVVKDYYNESLHSEIEPLALKLVPDYPDGYLGIKLKSEVNIINTIDFIEAAWNEHTNGKPFEYFFMDTNYERLYKSETTTGQLLLIFGAISVFISCIGLIGLIAYAITVRQKEIGIRKVLGAEKKKLMWLLYREVVIMILVSILISWPLSFLLSNFWLHNFADRIQLNGWYFPLATFCLLFIIVLAISFQIVKSSKANPVQLLRVE